MSELTRRRLARAAFAHSAAYDAAIVRWLDETEPDAEDGPEPLPETLQVVLQIAKELRYGENPHQKAALYRARGTHPGCWEGAVQHGGRELSYLNLLDAGGGLAAGARAGRPASASASATASQPR